MRWHWNWHRNPLSGLCWMLLCHCRPRASLLLLLMAQARSVPLPTLVSLRDLWLSVPKRAPKNITSGQLTLTDSVTGFFLERELLWVGECWKCRRRSLDGRNNTMLNCCSLQSVLSTGQQARQRAFEGPRACPRTQLAAIGRNRGRCFLNQYRGHIGLYVPPCRREWKPASVVTAYSSLSLVNSLQSAPWCCQVQDTI